MENKVDLDLNKELKYLLGYIQKNKDEYIDSIQEYILTVVYLLTNYTFRSEINTLRDKYKLPSKWLDVNNEITENPLKWIYRKSPMPPDSSNNIEIQNISLACHVNPKIWNEFIFSYLFFGDVKPLKPPDEQYFNAENEFNYRSKLEMSTKDIDSISIDTPRAYIRFFKDTTQKNLINFIKANWGNIQNMQDHLLPYPYARTKGYTHFKRDIQVYLLHFLGENIKSEEQQFLGDLEESKISDIIKSIQSKLTAIPQKSSST